MSGWPVGILCMCVYGEVGGSLFIGMGRPTPNVGSIMPWFWRPVMANLAC